MIRIQVKMSEEDFKKLNRLADLEYRDPRQQAGILIREALINRGLIEDEIQSKRQDPKAGQGVKNGK